MSVVTATAMDPLRELGKALVVFGIALAFAGVFLLIGGKLPFRIGHLPGDIAYQGRNGSFYFPIATCLLVSLVLSLLFWIVNLFRH
jgi:ABC-type tungstate transport system substrate-binding protein